MPIPKSQQKQIMEFLDGFGPVHATMATRNEGEMASMSVTFRGGITGHLCLRIGTLATALGRQVSLEPNGRRLIITFT